MPLICSSDLTSIPNLLDSHELYIMRDSLLSSAYGGRSMWLGTEHPGDTLPGRTIWQFTVVWPVVLELLELSKFSPPWLLRGWAVWLQQHIVCFLCLARVINVVILLLSILPSALSVSNGKHYRCTNNKQMQKLAFRNYITKLSERSNATFTVKNRDCSSDDDYVRLIYTHKLVVGPA